MFCALLNIEESSQFRSRPTGRLSLNSRVLKRCFKRINSSIEFLHLRNFLCPFLQKNDVCFASELVGLRLLTELVQQSNFMAISTCTVGFGKQTSSFGMYPSGHVSCASTSVPTMAWQNQVHGQNKNWWPPVLKTNSVRQGLLIRMVWTNIRQGLVMSCRMYEGHLSTFSFRKFRG